MSREYLIVFGVLFVVYCVIRAIYWVQIGRVSRDLPILRSEWKGSNWTGHPIDTSALADRIHHVRQDYAEELQSRPPQFKHDLLVEAKREEIAHAAFFQKPPPPAPEPEEEDHGLGLFLV